MKCIGKFKFKELVKKDGGKFTNAKGDEIEYKPSYSLKVDEVTENGIFERVFKIALDSPLVEKLQNVKPYTDISLEFDINLYNNSVRLIPLDIRS